ncbi:MAG: hypothetical protein ABSG63_20815, partial [Spirochaetia bacterium]
MKTRLDSDKHCEKLSMESEPFSKYYRDVRPQLGELLIFHDTDLPPGIRAQIQLQKGEIHLRYPEDTLDLAHELGHLVQKVQGFPSIKGSSDAAALNSALLDPQVDLCLAKCGFNLAASRDREIQGAKQTLERLGAPA